MKKKEKLNNKYNKIILINKQKISSFWLILFSLLVVEMSNIDE
jgi:hypothetical protein